VTTPTKRKWIFETAIRCPRCKQFNTFAVHTDAERGIQHRRCRGSLCRSVRFTIRGEPAATDKTSGHSGEQCICPHCGVEYERRSGLTKHIKKAHQGLASASESPQGDQTNGTGR